VREAGRVSRGPGDPDVRRRRQRRLRRRAVPGVCDRGRRHRLEDATERCVGVRLRHPTSLVSAVAQPRPAREVCPDQGQQTARSELHVRLPVRHRELLAGSRVELRKLRRAAGSERHLSDHHGLRPPTPRLRGRQRIRRADQVRDARRGGRELQGRHALRRRLQLSGKRDHEDVRGADAGRRELHRQQQPTVRCRCGPHLQGRRGSVDAGQVRGRGARQRGRRVWAAAQGRPLHRRHLVCQRQLRGRRHLRRRSLPPDPGPVLPGATRLPQSGRRDLHLPAAHGG
jgi:hypothetical protein